MPYNAAFPYVLCDSKHNPGKDVWQASRTKTTLLDKSETGGQVSRRRL